MKYASSNLKEHQHKGDENKTLGIRENTMKPMTTEQYNLNTINTKIISSSIT